MASRQEEKEHRRQERLEREAAEAKARARKGRLRLAGGAVLALAVVAGVVFALLTVLGGGDSDPEAVATNSENLPALPAQRVTDLDEAARAAGCRVVHPRYEGNGHNAEKNFAASDYRTNPPTSGDHDPEWYEDGVYAPGDVPELGKVVHTLEHGRIDVQYRPGTPTRQVSQLEALLRESNDGYHMLLFENTTDMPYAVAATAWTQMLGCREMNDQTFDAIRAFRARYIDKGPERIP